MRMRSMAVRQVYINGMPAPSEDEYAIRRHNGREPKPLGSVGLRIPSKTVTTPEPRGMRHHCIRPWAFATDLTAHHLQKGFFVALEKTLSCCDDLAEHCRRHLRVFCHSQILPIVEPPGLRRGEYVKILQAQALSLP